MSRGTSTHCLLAKSVDTTRRPKLTSRTMRLRIDHRSSCETWKAARMAFSNRPLHFLPRERRERALIYDPFPHLRYQRAYRYTPCACAGDVCQGSTCLCVRNGTDCDRACGCPSSCGLASLSRRNAVSSAWHGSTSLSRLQMRDNLDRSMPHNAKRVQNSSERMRLCQRES